MPKVKISTLKKQREAAELELIIEEFGRAMRNADRTYITGLPGYQYENSIRFTPNMDTLWWKYYAFCLRYPK